MNEQVGESGPDELVVEWPSAWGFRVFGDNGYTAFCGWVCVIAVPLMAVFTHDPQTKNYVVAAALAVGGIAMLFSSGLLGRSVRRGVALQDDPVVGFGVVMRGQRSSKAADVLLAVGIFVAVVSSGLEYVHQPHPSMYAWVLVFVMSVWILWAALSVRRRLVLTPNGIRSQVYGGQAFREGDLTVSWDDIVALKAGEAYGRTPINAVEVHTTPESGVTAPKWYPTGSPPTRTISGLVVPSAVALHAMQFYLAHPECRWELASERSIERFREWDEARPRLTARMNPKVVLPIVLIVAVGVGAGALMTRSESVGGLPAGSCFVRTWLSTGEVPAQVKSAPCGSADAEYRFLGTALGDHESADAVCRALFEAKSDAGVVRGRSFPKDDFGTVCVEVLG